MARPPTSRTERPARVPPTGGRPAAVGWSWLASLPELPPTSNKLYRVVRGRPIKSLEARAYEARAKLWLLEQLPQDLPVLRNCGIEFGLLFSVADLENSGWPAACETRYKRRDVTNRVKLLEDVVVDVLGYDDSQHLRQVVEKQYCETPSVEVTVRVLVTP